MSFNPGFMRPPGASSAAYNESYALSLAQLHDYGCMVHEPDQCPTEPVFLEAMQSFDQGNPDPAYCVPAIPPPADQMWPSPPFGKEVELAEARRLHDEAEDAAAHEAIMQDFAHAADEYGASAAPVTPMEPHSPDYPPSDLLAELAKRGCDFGCAPWEPGSPHYGPPGSCRNHPYGTCPSQNPYSYYVDRRRRLGLQYSYACHVRRPDHEVRNIRSRILKKRHLPKRARTVRASTGPQRKHHTQSQGGPAPPARRRHHGPGLSSLESLASALEESTAVPVDVTDLESLLSQVKISRRDRQRGTREPRKSKGMSYKKKKKGGKKKGGKKTKRQRQ